MTAKDDAADLPRSAPAPAPAPPQDRSPWPEVTIPLRHPIKGVDGAEITSLTFSEPDVEALERMEDLEPAEGERLKVRHLRAIAGALSRQPDDLIRRLRASDFTRVVEAMKPFLEYLVRQGRAEEQKDAAS